LLRHAKSSWDDPGLSDHDRPLAPRGRKAAKLIGRHLRDQGVEFSIVLCSSARRARDTIDLVDPPARIEVEPELYGASAGEMLERLRRLPEDVEAVMVVGHNPGIEDLALGLCGADSGLSGRKFPTGALATLSFTGPWEGLAAGRAALQAFVIPRELG
jgi:phosphohistidine phosphatase